MILKVSLKEQVVYYLIDEIVKGIIKPGQLISLAKVARELDVSVTPIREALNQLSRSGLVEAVPNRGFILAPLNKKEALELYPIIIKLESMAIDEGKYNKSRIKKLQQQNDRFAKAESIRQAVLEDERFHQLLIGAADNESLNRILKDLKIRILLYEIEFQSDRNLIQNSVIQHKELISKLESDEKQLAIAVLNSHWIESMYLIKKNLTK